MSGGRLLALVGVLSAACAFDPSFEDGTTQCSADEECPDGFECRRPKLLCYRIEDAGVRDGPLPDHAGTADARQAERDAVAPDIATDAPVSDVGPGGSPAEPARDGGPSPAPEPAPDGGPSPAPEPAPDGGPSPAPEPAPDGGPSAEPEPARDGSPSPSPDLAPAETRTCPPEACANRCESLTVLVRCVMVDGCPVPLRTFCPGMQTCSQTGSTAACSCPVVQQCAAGSSVVCTSDHQWGNCERETAGNCWTVRNIQECMPPNVRCVQTDAGATCVP